MIEPRPYPAGVIIWTDVQRFPQMEEFYTGILGLHRVSFRAGHVAYEHEGFRLTIGVHDDVGGAAREPLRTMLNLAVADIHSAAEQLSRAGVVFSRRPEQESWGGWIATFKDPDGNTVQLLQLPE